MGCAEAYNTGPKLSIAGPCTTGTMPTYQRFIINGIPFWKESGILYAFEPLPAPENLIRLGTEAGLDPGWEKRYEAKLAEYRATIKARSR